MNEIQLRDHLFELFPPETNPDWDDVLRRANSSPRHARRLTLLIAAAFLTALAVGSALALSGRLGDLFHGTPVKDVSPRERFLLSEFDMNGRVELVAERGSTAFYVIRRSDGRLCYSIGEIRKDLTPAQREGRMRFEPSGCVDRRVFPSRAMPVLEHSYFSYRPGDPASRLVGLQGFAADPVDRVGVIGRDKRIVFTVPVRGNVFTAGRKAFPGARGIVALDEEGKVLWVRCAAIGRSPAPQFPSGGCGRYKNSPPPDVGTLRPTKPATPAAPVVVQRGSANGVSVVVRGSQIEARFGGLSPEKQRLLEGSRGRINVGCFKLITIGGTTNASGVYVTEPFAAVVHAQIYGRTAPFDGCTVTGMYGHTWNDAHGTHDAVEIPFTTGARRFFAERAAARDIAWLARARVFREIRYAREALSAGDVARRLGSRVLLLNSPQATPPVGKLGIWLGKPNRIVLVERATTGRRLYLEIRRGVIYRTNLIGLA